MTTWILAHKLLTLYFSGSLAVLIFIIIFAVKELREHGFIEIEGKDLGVCFIITIGSWITIIIAAIALYNDYKTERIKKRTYTNNRL